MTYCYAELTVSSLTETVFIAITPLAYPRRDDQAELAWVSQLKYYDGLTVYPRTVTLFSTNWDMIQKQI